MRHIRNLTYRNFMIIVHKIMQKGYTFEESEPMARRVFDEYNPQGMSIETMVDRILSKEEWEKECAMFG